MAGPSFSQREFRNTLSTFATGVTIVTAVDVRNEPIGMTASSFNSVSMDPPLILWSVTKTALSGDAFKNAKRFAVHVLASDQIDISNRFAKSGEDKFGNLDFEIDENGVPVIANTASRFDCSQWATYEGGDHWIIVGRVENITKANAEALVFCGGSYAVANPLHPVDVRQQITDSEKSAVDGLLIYNLSRAYRQMTGQFHDVVCNSGLTLSEWRILASLHGGVSRDLADLAARTFVDPKALRDMVRSMEESGLCETQGDDETLLVSDTPGGHERVEHLFALSARQETEAVDNESDLKQLVALLQTIITKTNA